jgi:luciferase family oxidoreductase group 1
MSSELAVSVLDQAPVSAGSDAADAIREVAALARHAESLGYRRFWIAEHHAFGPIASTAPEVLIAHVAAATGGSGGREPIRVGSGGVLLPNHRPLHVAECFGVLEALYPGRIDLGIGRSEGTLNEAIVTALQRPDNATHETGYEQMVDELLAFAGVTPLSADHPLHSVRAVPAADPFPPIFMLGSSPSSAITAAAKGLGYAFAAYTNPDQAASAIRAYRRASADPHAILGVRVIVGENDEHAQALDSSWRLSAAQARAGTPQPLQDVETALAHHWSAAEAEHRAAQDLRADAIGGPETVAAKLDQLLAETTADELIVTTNVYDPAERFASYTRLASLLSLATA